MPNKRPDSKLKLSDGLYRLDHPDSDIFLPEPVRKPSMERSLGDYINNLRKKFVESYKFKQSSISNKPDESIISNKSSFEHICPNNPILTCNCSDPKFCSEQPNDNGWIKCPDSGKLCSIIDCPDGCKGDRRVELYREHQAEIDSKRENAVGGWPCVVVGFYKETRDETAEHVYRAPDSSGFAK